MLAILPFLKANWRLISYAVGALIIIVAIWVAVSTVSGWHDDSKALVGVRVQLEAQIETIKRNNEVTDEYQSKLSNLRTKYANLERVQLKRCVPVQSTRVSSNPAGIGGADESERGISAGAIARLAEDFALTAEYVDACAKWVKLAR